ncbi:hypothetical protein L0P53_14510, partial [Holdemanella sp. DFI.5.21]|nr:hypothetical protein [Holdemanella sp. DFI.5.21]
KYFLPFHVLSFGFFKVFFAVQKLLSLIRSHLFVFVSVYITIRSGLKKDIPVIYVRECSAYVFF